MNDNVRKIFDILGVEPNEEFDILLGDGVEFTFKCKIDEKLQGYYLMFNCWLVFDELLKDLLNGSNTIIKIPKKKHVGDLKCVDFGIDCLNCPLKVINCCMFKDDINTSSTLFECLDKNFEIFKEQEIYDIMKARLDKEVEE